jgi:uncharacterized repeat protein (TIGR02543 family)
MKKKLLIFFITLIFPVVVNASANISFLCTTDDIYEGDTFECSIDINSDYVVTGFSMDVSSTSTLELVEFKNVSGTDFGADLSTGTIDGYVDWKAAGTDFKLGTIKVKALSSGVGKIELSNIVLVDDYSDDGSDPEHSEKGVTAQVNVKEKPVTTTTTLTVTFDSNSGTLVGSNTGSCSFDSGSVCTINDIPTATRDGYTFKGWGTDKSCTEGQTGTLTISQSGTFYACWQKNADADTVTDTETPSNDSNKGNTTNSSNTSNNSSSSSNEQVKNPNTGTLSLVVVFVVMLVALGVSYYFYQKYNKENI